MSMKIKKLKDRDGLVYTPLTSVDSVYKGSSSIRGTLEGAVQGPNSSTSNHVATFSDTTGKAVKDSGYTISKSVPSNAEFTDKSVTSVSTHYTPTGTTTESASGATGTSGSTVQVVTGITMDAAGHVTDIVSGAATDTTYSDATTTAHGLMSTSDKSKLDGITASADSVSFAQSLTSGTEVGTITINGSDTKLYAPTDTDTKNTAGSTDSSAKLYLIGAQSQAANPQTYSHDTAYVGTDGCLYSGGAKVLTSHQSLSAYALLNSPTFTGTPEAPTADAGTNTTQIATTAFVMNAFQANDAMIFKGTVNADSDLPSTHDKGWTYKVATAGTYAGKVCEVGDMIICVVSGDEASDSDWAVIQSNIDGAVTGPSASTANHIATFSGTTGKVIKDSGYTIAKSVPSDAVFTDTTYSNATTSAAGLMSASDKGKLDGIASGAEVNQNAFSNVTVGSTTLTADSETDTLTLVAGNNVTITPNASSDSVTIAATDTTYSNATSSASGLMSSSDKSKLDGISNSADSVSFTQSLASGTKVGTITINGAGTDLYAPTNTDTHYESSTVVADSSTATADADSSNGSTYLNHIENGVVKSSHLIVGTGSTTVTSDDGVITVNSTDTKYSAGTGIGITGTTISNSGVLSVSSGSNNGTISVNTNGTSSEVSVKGLGSAAYTASTDYATSNHTHGLSVESSSGTSSISLSANTKYQITAGGSTFIFTTPPDENTTYSSKSAVSGGTDVSLVTTGEKYTWNNKGTYSKPSTGIPKSDLASGVQTSLGLADSALQSHQSVSSGNNTAEWGSAVIVGTVGSTDLKFTMPTSPFTGPSSSIDGNIAIFDGTTGKVIADSGYTIAKSVPSNAVFTDTTYSAGTGLSLSNTTFSLGTSGATSGSYGPSADVTGSDGATISVPQVTVDSYGRVTSITERTYTSVNTTYSDATTSADGLMSSSDKSKLDGITESADSVSFTQSLTSGTEIGTITISGTSTVLYAPESSGGDYLPLTGGTLTGNLYAPGYYISSSRKVKENIRETSVKGLDMVNSIDIVDFNYINDEEKMPKVGFIAEDTDSLLSTPHMNVMDPYNCIGVLFKAVQELSAEVNELKAKISELS